MNSKMKEEWENKDYSPCTAKRERGRVDESNNIRDGTKKYKDTKEPLWNKFIKGHVCGVKEITYEIFLKYLHWNYCSIMGV